VRKFVTGEHHEPRIHQASVTFEHDEETVTAFPPTPAQFAMYRSAVEAVDGDINQVADIVNFFFALFEQEDRDYFRGRLFDPDDPFDLGGDGGMVDLIATLLATWLTQDTPAQDEALSH